ncbi:TraK family protein [Pseudomonas paraeruginosa]|uniref:TraK family protein n=1 Tax=Pseudomonas paraeruginosa TaxID=2994495 RepID=UPI0034D69960
MRTLSERIAERIQRKPTASAALRNRSTFINLRNEIQRAYTDGWSLLAIWKTLHDEGRISFTYQAFRRYAHQLIDLPMPSASSKSGKPLQSPLRSRQSQPRSLCHEQQTPRSRSSINGTVQFPFIWR